MSSRGDGAAQLEFIEAMRSAAAGSADTPQRSRLGELEHPYAGLVALVDDVVQFGALLRAQQVAQLLQARVTPSGSKSMR